MWIFDTGVCIALIKRRPPILLAQIQRRRIGELAVSTITAAELEYGVAKSRRVKQNANALELFLTSFDILQFDAEAAARYGSIRAHLERKGTPIGPLDTLIASQAVCAGAALVTCNTREFSRVPGLKVENWLGE